MAETTRRATAPSLRRRLLAFLLIPVGGLLLLDALLTYGVALAYSNRVHDSDLSDDALTLAQMLRQDNLGGELSPQARFLLEYDPDGRSYFTVRSSLHGRLAGNERFPHPPAPDVGAPPLLYSTQVGQRLLRAAMVSIHPANNHADTVTVTIAETLRDRRRKAREILLLAVPLQTLLILSVLSLVWFGVRYGLRVLQPLTARLASRESELTPIGDADVPLEILPLTRTIDALFSRLREAVTVQERFLADAAHQLRTPLTGLRLHVERALADSSPATVGDALEHIRQLTLRATRTSTQLLAMTRAQSPLTAPSVHQPVELTRLVRDTVGLRIHEALAAGVDLGYQGPARSLYIHGDAAGLEELLDNLIDNCLRYAGRGRTVTVSVAALPDGGAALRVEDNGPGVPESLLARLGERFFRVPGNHGDGTGLGLAIVQRIAERHHAEVTYSRSPQQGLSVAVRFAAMHAPTAP